MFVNSDPDHLKPYITIKVIIFYFPENPKANDRNCLDLIPKCIWIVKLFCLLLFVGLLICKVYDSYLKLQKVTEIIFVENFFCLIFQYTGGPRYSRWKWNLPPTYVVNLDLVFAVLLFTFKKYWNVTPSNSEENLYSQTWANDHIKITFCGPIRSFYYLNNLWTTTICQQRPLFLGPNWNFQLIMDLWTATTCQQRPLYYYPKDGRYAQFWL